MHQISQVLYKNGRIVTQKNYLKMLPFFGDILRVLNVRRKLTFKFWAKICWLNFLYVYVDLSANLFMSYDVIF